MRGLDVRAVVERGAFRLDAVLTAEPGSTVAVMGPSGAGKSTLLEIIAGLVDLQEGHVRIGARELTEPGRTLAPRQRGVVMLGQHPHLFPHLTVCDNVAFGLRARGMSRAAARREATEWLHRVDTADLAMRYPRHLSGGQQQRVALARALATDPAVLLLDEPFTALDPETSSGVRAMVAERLSAAHTTTVVVTHDAVDAAALADRLVLLEQGRVTQSGDVREVLTTPSTAFGATVAGLERVEGRVRGGVWTANGGAFSLPARGAREGRCAALFPPASVALEPHSDGLAEGHDDAAWIARVSRVEQTPAGVRVHTSQPDVAVDLDIAAYTHHRLRTGASVRVWITRDAVRLVS
ncbi:MAG: ATP-binding cassette domain-containing protein [Microbacterium sp.]|nr:MAG: ATP-binding cassette domain-containing protein [Microbacterium sp.]